MKYVIAMAVIFSSINVHAVEVVAPPVEETAAESQVSQQVAVVDVDAALKEIQVNIENAGYPDMNADAE